jgi:hypothetical protein
MQFRSASTTKQQQHDVFSTLRIQRERELFHQQIMSDDTIQILSPKMTAPAAVFGDSLHVRFTAFDETFDMELNVDRNSIDSRTRVFAGVPGDETLCRPQLITYAATTVDAQGAEITASFTVMHDKRIRGIFVRGGEIYQVAPMDHLEADLAVETRLKGTQSVQNARLSTLRSRAALSSGMVVYKLSEIRTTNEAGEPQLFCSAIDPDTDESHLDPIVAPTGPADDGFSATSAGSVSRHPLLQRWTDCHPHASGYGIKMYMDYVMDVGAALHYSDSKTTVSPVIAWTRLAEVQAAANVFYTTQMAVTLTFHTIVLRTGSSSETWNQYAYDDDRSSGNTLDNDGYLSAARQYRMNDMTDEDRGAAMQFVTRSFRSGVIGQAYVGVLRRTTGTGIGFSSISSDAVFVKTLSHEILHQCKSRHPFETCVGEYEENKGGIMDYSNGKLGSLSDSPGEVGFHSVCSKREACPHIAERFSDPDSSRRVPFVQSFAVITAAPVPVCGDGVVEGDEECDLYGTDNECCVGCRLVDGATCFEPGECCVGCKLQPATTSCGTEGFCGPQGKCEASRCSTYNSADFCGGVKAESPCEEQCYYTFNGVQQTSCQHFDYLQGRRCTTAAGTDGICRGTGMRRSKTRRKEV